MVFEATQFDALRLVYTVDQINPHILRRYGSVILSHPAEAKLAQSVLPAGIHFALLREEERVIAATGNLFDLDVVEVFYIGVWHEHVLHDPHVGYRPFISYVFRIDLIRSYLLFFVGSKAQLTLLS